MRPIWKQAVITEGQEYGRYLRCCDGKGRGGYHTWKGNSSFNHQREYNYSDIFSSTVILPFIVEKNTTVLKII
jgi:hypothetical protein